MKITISELKGIIQNALCESAFDKMQFSGKNSEKSHTFTAYHWSETPEEAERIVSLWEKKKLDSRGLYVTDDIETWNVNVSSLIKLKVTVNNPLVIGDDESLESWLSFGKSKNKVALLKRNRFDSIVSVPKNEVVGTRQMLLFYPNVQITSMKLDHNNAKKILTKST